MKGRRLARHGVVAAAYLAVVLAVFAPLVPSMDRALTDLSDPLLNAWIMAWDLQALLRDPRRLFQAPPFFPYANTLAFSEHLLGLSLIAAPIQLGTGNPILAYNAALLFAFWSSAMGMYHLVRRLTGRLDAAFLAGLLYALAPYRAAHHLHLHLLATAWLPLTVLAALDHLRRPSPRREGALLLAAWMALWTSWHIAAFAGILLGLYLALALGLGPRNPRALPGLLGVGTALGLAAAVLLPPYREARALTLSFRTYEMLRYFSARPTDFLAASPLLPWSGRLTAPFRARPGITPEHYLFPGILTTAMALIGLLAVRRLEGAARPAALTMALAVLLGVGLTLGPVLEIGPYALPTPYGWALERLEDLRWMRVPARWFALAVWGLTGLAGLGAAALLGRISRPPARAAALALLALGARREGFFRLPPLGFLPDLPSVYRWLAGQPGDFAIIELPMHVFPDPEYPEAWRMYGTLFHGKRLVNGYSGLTPLLTQIIGRKVAAFPTEEAARALAELGRIGVRMAIVDMERYRDRRCEIVRWPFLHPLYEDERHLALEIATHPEALTAIPAAEWIPLDVRFGQTLALRGYRVKADPPRLFLRWAVLGPGGRDLSAAVHFLDREGQVVAQQDGPPPSSGFIGFGCWPVGAEIQEVRFFPNPPERWGEVQRIRLGVYRWASGTPLPAFAGGEPLPTPFLEVPASP